MVGARAHLTLLWRCPSGGSGICPPGGWGSHWVSRRRSAWLAVRGGWGTSEILDFAALQHYDPFAHLEDRALPFANAAFVHSVSSAGSCSCRVRLTLPSTLRWRVRFTKVSYDILPRPRPVRDPAGRADDCWLHRADADPGAGHSPCAHRARRTGNRADGHRQDGRLRPSHPPSPAGRAEASGQEGHALPGHGARPANWPARSPTASAPMPPDRRSAWR